LNRNIVGGVGG